jgi:hypothetical protein
MNAFVRRNRLCRLLEPRGGVNYSEEHAFKTIIADEKLAVYSPGNP